jgi:flagellar protein FlaF
MWSTLVKALATDANKLPNGLKSQLIDLAAWSMRYSTLAILHDLPVAPLIAVNRNVTDGLSAQARAVPAATGAALSAAISA